MSYILEALRKSEKKRPPGAVPDLFTVQGPQPAGEPRRPLWVLGAAAVVMVFAGVGAWLWLGGRERVPEVTSTEQSPKASTSSGGAPREAEAYAPVGSVPSAPASSVPRPAAPTAAASRPAAAPAAGNRRAAGGGTPAPGARVPPVPSPQPPAAIMPPESRPGSPGEAAAPMAAEREIGPAAPPAGAPPAAAVAQPPAGVPRTPAAAPSAPASPAAAPPGTQAPAPAGPAPAAVPEKAPAPPAAPAAVPVPAAVDAAPPAPRTRDAVAAEAEAPPADGRIVAVEELPQSVRAALGKFTVSGHVWSEEPALRLLTVENRLVREGQEAAPGVRLEEITPDGAVFTLKGWRFRIAGF